MVVTMALKSLTLSTPFLKGTSPLSPLSKPLSFHSPKPSSFLPPIKAFKTFQGTVVCATSDKTVAVVVTRLACDPLYGKRVRIKKKYQAHDPENKFKVGDFVQLERCRPISKTKSFLAVPVPPRIRGSQKNKEAAPPSELGIPLESQQD